MAASSSRVLSLRAVVGGVALAVALGGFAAGSPAAAAGACPTYTDPAGDAVVAGEPVGVTADDNMDVLAVSHSVDAGVFTTVIKVAKLYDTGPAFSFWDRFVTTFTVAKKAVEIRGDRDLSGEAPVITGSLRVNAALTPAKVTPTFDVKTSTVTLAISSADLEKAAGVPLAGEAFSAMTSRSVEPMMPPVTLPMTVPVPSVGNVGGVQLSLNIDTATAPTTAAYVFGGSCAGGAGTPPATPTPSPAPTEEEEEEEEEGEEEEEEEEPTGPVLFDQPRTGCFLFKDDEGDAFPGVAPISSPESDPASDITEVSLRSPADALNVFVKVAALGAPAIPLFDGHKFTIAFTVGGKPVSVVATGTGAAESTPATIKATATLDEAKSNVVFTIPKADLETVIGKPLAEGTPITGLTVTSNQTTLLGPVIGDGDGDSATGTTDAQKTYAYGDNACFVPPAGKLTLGGASSGVFTDTAVVSGTLLDSADKPVEGATLHLMFTGQPPVSAKTDATGKATFVLPMKTKAGNNGLAVQFNGNDTVGPAGAGKSFTVLPETAVLTAKAGRGSVTATLLDNDKAPIGGQTVSFTVGSKVHKLKTNAKGVAVLSRQAAGSTAKVSFAAVPGSYTAAKTVSVKVG